MRNDAENTNVKQGRWDADDAPKSRVLYSPDRSRRSRRNSLDREYERRGTRERSHRHSERWETDGEQREHRRPDRPDERDFRRREGRYRDRSTGRGTSRDRRRSRSPPSKRRRRSYSRSLSPARKSRGPLPSQQDFFRGELERSGQAPAEAVVPKQKPNYKPTGLLAKEANTITGTTTVLKYHEPPEGRKPPESAQWRMYIFKGKDLLETIHLYQRSVWLMGRDEKVTDLLLEHPSISKQHAVIQFRYLANAPKKNSVLPYLIDLESANGTKLNGETIETSRYISLQDQDVLTFGDSDREYVMMLPSS